MENETTNHENNSSHETEIQATVEQLVQEIAEDYRNYLNFDITKEQSKYYESIEGMLTKLEEFCGLVDLIRSDTNLCLNTTLPKIQEKCIEMRHVFDRINKLVQFVEVVKRDVNIIEEKVTQAEKDVGDSIGSGLIKKLSSIVGSKKSKEKKKVEYEEPLIFNTDQYFPKNSQTLLVEQPDIVNPSPTPDIANPSASSQTDQPSSTTS
ncbi:hypothetical protein LOTGIDRAFT_233804 [Lottia gigantea]|uniref:Biogenesis of lysosome-related organelles complex 1 subunit 4 n=1 Tax=Lottia gigantea TaxID=225164 RepID=V4BMR5_LOTGI|nr:hypothetical protein LOTGIDRAFT_233804 [Lottia gigantea]ESO90264.1 hypothetical protein LOTGIDRAFT_233804 [Lottia gigantea]